MLLWTSECMCLFELLFFFHIYIYIYIYTHTHTHSGVELRGHVIILLFVRLSAPDLGCSNGISSWGVWVIVPWPATGPRPPALGVQSLSHCTTSRVPAFSFQFLGTCIFFSTERAPTDIPISSVPGLPFPHVLANIVICVLFITDIMTGVRCYLIMVLICVSLMISNVEHIFKCLLASECPLWKIIYSGFLPNFLLFFWCWIIWTVYILDINPLSVISFANIFYHRQ